MQDALWDKTVQLFLRTAQCRSMRADAHRRFRKSKRRVAVQRLREAVEGLRVAGVIREVHALVGITLLLRGEDMLFGLRVPRPEPVVHALASLRMNWRNRNTSSEKSLFTKQTMLWLYAIVACGRARVVFVCFSFHN